MNIIFKFTILIKSINKNDNNINKSGLHNYSSISDDLKLYLIDIAKKFKLRQIGQIEWKLLDDIKKETQFERDIIIFYKTFYPENDLFPEFEPKTDYDDRSNALKTLLLFIATNGVKFSAFNNKILNDCSKGKDWNFPLASSLLHGGRILFKLGSKNPKEFLNKVFIGTYKNQLYYNRIAASHSVSFTNNTFTEDKVTVMGLIDGLFYGSHKAFDFSIGGYGNLWPSKNTTDKNSKPVQTIISSQGYGAELKNNVWIIDKYKQTGHLYLRWDFHGEKQTNNTLLVGIEEERPGSAGMFSSGFHNAFSAFKSRDNNPSVSGGSKWIKFIDLKPELHVAKYGGKCLEVKNDYNDIDRILSLITNVDKLIQKFTWWVLLSSVNDYNFKIINEVITSPNYEGIMKEILNSS